MVYMTAIKRLLQLKELEISPIFFQKLYLVFQVKISENSLTIKNQHVSNDKYLKLYRIKSNLVDYNQDNRKFFKFYWRMKIFS